MIPISIRDAFSFEFVGPQSFPNKDVIVCEIMELLSSLSLFPRSLLLPSSTSSISIANPEDLLPIDIHDSPDDEKLGIDEPAEFPEDVDVIDDPPGDEDSNDELEDVDVGNVGPPSSE
jgi:hypothetical protein